MKESSEEKIKQILKSKINIPSGYVDAINTAFIKKGKSNHFIKILTTTCAGIILTSGIVLAGYNIYQKICNSFNHNKQFLSILFSIIVLVSMIIKKNYLNKSSIVTVLIKAPLYSLFIKPNVVIKVL